jgi:CrcB protein
VTTALVWSGVMVIGGIASVARFLVDREVGRRTSERFPLGTMVVNVTGSFALGLVSALTVGSTAALLVGTAAIGAYTTFSTWVFETQRLSEERQLLRAIGNIVISLLLGLAAAALGHWIGGQA